MLLGLGISAPEAFRNGESQAGLLDGCRTLQHYLMCVTDTGAEFGLLLLQLTSREHFMSTLPPRWTEQCNWKGHRPQLQGFWDCILVWLFSNQSMPPFLLL